MTDPAPIPARLRELQRYTLTDGEQACEPDDNGAWVLWKDVEAAADALTTPPIHYGTEGEQSAEDVPTACGQRCSTWDKPMRYTWERDKTTCPACLAALSDPRPPAPDVATLDHARLCTLADAAGERDSIAALLADRDEPTVYAKVEALLDLVSSLSAQLTERDKQLNMACMAAARSFERAQKAEAQITEAQQKLCGDAK